MKLRGFDDTLREKVSTFLHENRPEIDTIESNPISAHYIASKTLGWKGSSVSELLCALDRNY